MSHIKSQDIFSMWKKKKKEIELECHQFQILLGALTHCRRNRLSHTIYWKTPISILGTSSYEIYIFLEKKG